MSINNRRYKRSPFAVGKWVRLIKAEDNSYPKSYLIMDISMGGIGVVSARSGEFTPGERFYILDIDGHPTEKKIKLEVKYVRPVDGPENKFRVGCEFLEISTIK